MSAAGLSLSYRSVLCYDYWRLVYGRGCIRERRKLPWFAVVLDEKLRIQRSEEDMADGVGEGDSFHERESAFSGGTLLQRRRSASGDGKEDTRKIQKIASGLIAENSRVLFVDDGSSDRTWELIESYHEKDPLYQGIKLSRNRGHQNALMAGLMTVRTLCDMAISMDADLQDDVDAIDKMILKFQEGADVVYGVRSSRKTDTFFKKTTAQTFYRLMNTMGAQTVYNHADFRLLSRRALVGLSEFREVNMFLRGMVPLVGFPSDVVYYERAERFAGTSKYPLKKMIRFAMEGITSLSTEPIQWITKLGFFIFLVSIAFLIYTLVQHATGHTEVGWSSTFISIWAIGGLIMISLGVLGDYIGRIYLETKARPRYIIETYLKDPDREVDLIDPAVGRR